MPNAKYLIFDIPNVKKTLRAFTSGNAISSYFTIPKSYFINYTILQYFQHPNFYFPILLIKIIYSTITLIYNTTHYLEAVWMQKFHHSISITHHLILHTRLALSLTFHHSIFFTLFVGPIPVNWCNFFFFFSSTQIH